MMEQMGDKIQSKIMAKSCNVPTIPGVESPLLPMRKRRIRQGGGLPHYFKGSRWLQVAGIRIDPGGKHLLKEYHSAVSEATKAFGDGTIFCGKISGRAQAYQGVRSPWGIATAMWFISSAGLRHSAPSSEDRRIYPILSHHRRAASGHL